MFRRGVQWLLDRPVIALALSGLTALLLIVGVAFAYVRSAGTHEAIREAERITRLAGHGVIEPALTDDLLSGKPEAIARIDRLVETRLNREIVRVKIWQPDGTIVYSDDPRADRQALRAGSRRADGALHRRRRRRRE